MDITANTASTAPAPRYARAVRVLVSFVPIASPASDRESNFLIHESVNLRFVTTAAIFW